MVSLSKERFLKLEWATLKERGMSLTSCLNPPVQSHLSIKNTLEWNLGSEI